MSAVLARTLSKTYPRVGGPPVRALDALTLEIPRGAALGPIGPNGAGKTTFIELLLGALIGGAGLFTAGMLALALYLFARKDF